MGAPPHWRYHYLLFRRLVRNNLGGQGPDSGAEGMTYRTINMADGEEVELRVHALTPYKPFSPKDNGYSDQYGNINLKADTSVDLNMSFHDPHTNAPKRLATFPLSVFDLDEDPNGLSQEYVIVKGFDRALLSSKTEIRKVPQPDGRTRFHSSTWGHFGDNPTSIDDRTQRQKNRAVSFIFSNVSWLVVTLGVGHGTTPRILYFESKLAVGCVHGAPYKLLPLVHHGKQIPVDVPPGCTFEAWHTEVGNAVEKGDPLAEIRTADGNHSYIRAPRGGLVMSRQPLEPGDQIDDAVANSTLVVIDPSPHPHMPPMPLKPGQVPVRSDPGNIFVEWKASVGDIVKQGDPVAVVENTDGIHVAIRAPSGGAVISRQPLEPGDRIESVTKDSVMVIIDPRVKFPRLPLEHGQVPVKADGGSVFVAWRKDVGGVVGKGDPVAEVRGADGTHTVLRAPRRGVVVARQPLEPGDRVEEVCPGSTVVVIDPYQKFPALPLGGLTPIQSAPGAIFVSWRADVGDAVDQGDPLAVVKGADGVLSAIRAPREGVVVARQPLEPGDRIDYVLANSTIAIIDPHPKLPSLPVGGGQVPVKSASGKVFVKWLAEVGDGVETGDPLAVVRDEGRQHTVIKAPKAGTVVARLPLEPGNNIDYVSTDQVVAVIEPASGLFPWVFGDWGDLLLPLLMLCCCPLLCMLLMCIAGCKDKNSPNYGPLPQDSQWLVPLDSPRNKIQARELESLWKLNIALPPEPGTPAFVRFDFSDGKGTMHTYYFDHRPLGIIYYRNRATFVRVKGFKYNSYAKFKGVEEGWVLARVGHTDISSRDDMPVLEKLQLAHDSLRHFKVWPLKLEFEIDGQQESFMIEKYPIGITFSAQTPIIINKVLEGSYAESLGLKMHSEIVEIHEEVVRGHAYDSVMGKFRDAVDLLDVSGGPNPHYL